MKRSEPSMTEPMNEAKIMPKGRSGEVGGIVVGRAARVAFKAGVQKNTNRYMLPSKKHEASPIVRMRLSESTTEIADFVGSDASDTRCSAESP